MGIICLRDCIGIPMCYEHRFEYWRLLIASVHHVWVMLVGPVLKDTTKGQNVQCHCSFSATSVGQHDLAWSFLLKAGTPNFVTWPRISTGPTGLPIRTEIRRTADKTRYSSQPNLSWSSDRDEKLQIPPSEVAIFAGARNESEKAVLKNTQQTNWWVP